MAKFPIDLSRFKKISTNGKNTVLAHPSGHKFIVSHSALSPEHKEELHKLPFAGGGEVKDPTQEHLLPGDKNPNKIEKAVVKEAKGKMADGGVVAPAGPKKYVPSANAPEVKDQQGKTDDEVVDSASSPSLQHTVIKEKVAPRSEGKILGVYAEGGDVEKEPIPAVAETGATGVTGAPTELAQAPNMPPVESTAAPVTEEAKAEPNITLDPAIAEKQQIYNELQGANPKVPHEPATAFGPNGEFPAKFNRVLADKAEQIYRTRQAEKAAAANSSTQDAILENKARVNFGGAALPLAAAQQPQMQAMGTPQRETPPQSQQQPPLTADSNDPYGINAQSKAFETGFEGQKAGIAQEAAQTALLGENQQKVLEQAAVEKEKQQTDYQTHYNNLEQERQSFINDVQNQHIDPNHYLSNLDTGGRISTAIGLILGGMGAGMTHGQNTVLAYLNSAIDRDINAQRDELGKKQNLLSANLHQFGNLRDATEMTKIMQNDIVANKLQAEAAKAQGPLAKARAQQLTGLLYNQNSAAIGQMAARKTLMNNVKGDPAATIQLLVPQHQQAEAKKELAAASNGYKMRDAMIAAFDKIVQTNTLGNRILNPIESRRIIESAIGMAIPALSKESTGRYTEADSAAIEKMVNTLGSDPKAAASQRRDFVNLANKGLSKGTFPTLDFYHINPSSKAAYDENGVSRFKEGVATR